MTIGGSIDILNPGNYTINAGWGDGVTTTIVVKAGGVQFMGYDPVVFETKVDDGTLSNDDLMALPELKVAKRIKPPRS